MKRYWFIIILLLLGEIIAFTVFVLEREGAGRELGAPMDQGNYKGK